MAPPAPVVDRRARMLDGAVDLVAGGGMSALTHRSVEAAAGVPHGSVTYHFGGRDGLVGALVGRLCDESEAQIAAIAQDVALALADRSDGGAGPDVGAVADAIVRWIEGNSQVHLARLELELAAGRDADVRQAMVDAAGIFWRMCEPLVLAMGSTDPVRDGRAVAAMVDGLVLDVIAHGMDRDVVTSAVAHLLRRWADDAPAD